MKNKILMVIFEDGEALEFNNVSEYEYGLKETTITFTNGRSVTYEDGEVEDINFI